MDVGVLLRDLPGAPGFLTVDFARGFVGDDELLFGAFFRFALCSGVL